jgi:hypothetical protein
MPDGWSGYDLAVETGEGLARVSVKTRSETLGWKAGSWFLFDDRLECDWLVFVFKPLAGPVRSWVIPFPLLVSMAIGLLQCGRIPITETCPGAKLNREPLARYENNWELKR